MAFSMAQASTKSAPIGLDWGHLANFVLGGGLLLLYLFALLLLPLVLLPLSLWWAVVLVPVVLLTNSYWSLAHEAIHGNFHPAPRLNAAAGRVLAVVYGSAFRLLRFGHLTHHRYNRYPMDRPESFDPTKTRRFAANLRYFANLLGGAYFIAVCLPLVFLFPRGLARWVIDKIYNSPDAQVRAVQQLARQTLLRPRAFREIRHDAALVLLLYGSAFWSYGQHWPILAAFLYGRALLIALLDNVYHYRTPIERRDFAYNLYLPRPFRLMLLNFNLHQVHHRQPGLPWWQLPERFSGTAASYDGSLLGMCFRQFSGVMAEPELRPAVEAQ